MGAFAKLDGFDVIESDFLEPDFYQIHNWSEPRKYACPIWMTIFQIDGKLIMHPTVFEKLKLKSVPFLPSNCI